MYSGHFPSVKQTEKEPGYSQPLQSLWLANTAT
jgi:hypothetical protein